MSSAKKKRKLEVVKLNCRWENCGEQCENDWQLNDHIKTHLSDYLKNKQLENYICVWDSCYFVTPCKYEYQRHVYYHGYYIALLEQGKFVCENNPEIPKCAMAKRIGDKIPELKHNFQCRWVDCKRDFLSIVEFQDHMVKHITFDYEIQKSPYDARSKSTCNWDFCNKQLENKYRLIEHVCTHTNKKLFGCYNCGETFRTKSTLFDHLRRQPENNTHDYQCAHCFKYFSTEKLLRMHVDKHVNSFKCTLCNMTCTTLNALTVHIRYRHLKDKPFECQQCEVRCVRRSDLDKHIKLKHTNSIHNCVYSGCNYSVKCFTQMRRHILEVHEDTPIIYACHCCNKFFKSGNSLSTHLIKKHNFQLPSGHKRFVYHRDENGYFRLETMRIESLEVSQQILTPINTNVNEQAEYNTSYSITNLNSDGSVHIIFSNNSTVAQTSPNDHMNSPDLPIT